MGLKAGIVGLPNVGKSTVFNAITKSHVLMENYPFATIEPNTGVVMLNDKRFDRLCEIFKPKSKVKATFEFTDIAGLVKGASNGQGLGNKFLDHIRQVDAIIHVIRCFKNDDIIHVENSIDAIRDIEVINMELIMADYDVCKKRYDKVFPKAKSSKDKDSLFEIKVLDKVIKLLEEGNMLKDCNLAYDELKVLSILNLLTLKPTIYVGNVSEKEYSNPSISEEFLKVSDYAKKHDSECIPICAQTECELASLSDEEKKDFLSMLNITMSGLDQITLSAYHLLNLKTFFTTGADEVRAWTFKNGMTAPNCAGIIHSDLEKGFIKAEVYKYEDIDKFGSEAELKSHGKIETVGKDYLVQDGDCLYIKFNVTK